MSLKNPVTTPGIDPGTVRLVAQRLNHYATPGPVRKCNIVNYQQIRLLEAYLLKMQHVPAGAIVSDQICTCGKTFGPTMGNYIRMKNKYKRRLNL